MWSLYRTGSSVLLVSAVIACFRGSLDVSKTASGLGEKDRVADSELGFEAAG